MSERESPPLPRPMRILVVDDNDVSRITTRWFLSNLGFEVESARNGEEGLEVFYRGLHDLVITDNSMPGMSGAEMAQAIKARSPGTPILMYSGKPARGLPLPGLGDSEARPSARSQGDSQPSIGETPGTAALAPDPPDTLADGTCLGCPARPGIPWSPRPFLSRRNALFLII